MRRSFRAWLMRHFNLVSAEYATSLRERNEELTDDLYRLRIDLAEADGARQILQRAFDDCRKNHWRVALMGALTDVKKQDGNGKLPF